MGTPSVSTHAPGLLLGRLSVFRLRDAARRRDLALQEVEDTYQREVAAILSQDRPAAEGLRKRQRGNLHPWWHTYRYTWPPQKQTATTGLCEPVLAPFDAAIKPGIHPRGLFQSVHEIAHALGLRRRP